MGLGLNSSNYKDVIDKVNKPDVVDKIESWHRVKCAGRNIRGFFAAISRKFKKKVKETGSIINIMGIGLGTIAKTILLADGGQRESIKDYVKTKHVCLCGDKIDIDEFWGHTEVCSKLTELDEREVRARNAILNANSEYALVKKQSKQAMFDAHQKAMQTENEMLSKIEHFTKIKKENMEQFNKKLILLRDISALANTNVQKTIEKERKKEDYKVKLKNTHGIKKIFMLGIHGLSKLQVVVNVGIKVGLMVVTAWIAMQI